MDQRTDKNIKYFVSTIVKNNPRVLKAYLFGSYARKLNKPDSDIDIALIVKDLTDEEKFDLQVQLLLLASEYDSRIEPHLVSDKDLGTENPFILEILKTGIEIKPQMSGIMHRPRQLR